jgi:hypothetical protein
MAVPGPSASAGIERPQPVPSHLARSVARSLAARLFDAWDSGDAAAFANLFTSDGRWTDPTGESASDLIDRFGRWRSFEPWSVHWLSNEEVTVDGGELRGTWLWSSASNIDHGATPAWSGGDLTMAARHSTAGWRISELTMTDRYRTPYQAGWLAVPGVSLELGSPRPSSGRRPIGRPDDRGRPPPDIPNGRAIDMLGAEVDVRALVWGFIDDLESRVGGATSAERWVGQGSLELASGTGSVLALGATEVAKALDDETEHPDAVMRVLFSVDVDVDRTDDRARCRWRDLWTAYRGGEGVWLAHNYEVGAVRLGGAWKFDTMVRRRVLDCPYATGWAVGRGAPAAPMVGVGP